jgi:hypothetical protein
MLEVKSITFELRVRGWAVLSWSLQPALEAEKARGRLRLVLVTPPTVWF